MTLYFYFLGDIEGSYSPKLELQWDKMLKGTRDECI